jgi:hypothetical protein
MLKHGIGVSRPEIDTGVDVISHCQGEVRLIQIKTRYGEAGMRGRSGERFSVRRRRHGTGTKVYSKNEFDVFLFVSLATNRFWVVPADQINLSSHTILLTQDSPWLNAWHFLTPRATKGPKVA